MFARKEYEYSENSVHGVLYVVKMKGRYANFVY